MTAHSVFISYATENREVAVRLRNELHDLVVKAWLDCRELVAGADLPDEIKGAIQEARFFILLLSKPAMDSHWVAKERDWALQRGNAITLIPLLLEGVTPSDAQRFFDGRELLCIDVGADDLQGSMSAILAALGLCLPDHAPAPAPLPVVPVEELILHLSQATLVDAAGKRRGKAKAKLVYHSAAGSSPMWSPEYSFLAPLGPIEAEEISWYLERFPRWPGEAFRGRAQAVEARLSLWGQQLYQAALGQPKALAVRMAWEAASRGHQRRFTVWMDDAALSVFPSAPVSQSVRKKKVAMAQLLSLPWEVLHDGTRFLFQGFVPVRVRRRLPNRIHREILSSAPPLRVLLLSPRPEDEQASYIDHRGTAQLVAEVLAGLGNLARLTILPEPTLTALAEELRRAERAREPYHVVHFDGHGVYLQDKGMGALCFEKVDQKELLRKRATHRVDAKELVGELAGLRIPLIFLDACQGGQAQVDPVSSVAAALLDQGAAAVVAMSHSVLVATAKVFVKVFYQKLAEGERLGEAMLAGQRHLYHHKFRGDYLGAGRLELQDWFVPVLYQEEGDPALVAQVPSQADQEWIEKRYLAHLGELPEPPPHHFVGRSRHLLALERLLLAQNYGVLLGEGGEGKTALGVEAARWLLRIQRVQRVVFVSLGEATHWKAVLDAIGRQLVHNYSVSVSTFADWEKACLPVERALRAERTLLLLDNMETVLPPRPGGLAREYEPKELEKLLALFQRLQGVKGSKLLFTSRERLPEPFDAEYNHLDIGPLEEWDAVEMVKNILSRADVTPELGDALDGEARLLELVHSVRCHARTLTLLAPELARRTVLQTTEALHRLMAALEKKHPNDRERSLYAGVALSLDRLSPAVQQAIRPLGVFQGGGHWRVIGYVLGIEEPEQLLPLVGELLQSGLCDFHENSYLTFHFALAPFLWGELSESERQAAQQRWLEGEADFIGFLQQQKFQDAQLSAALTLLDLNNLLAGLERAASQWPAERVLPWVSRLTVALQELGKPSAMRQVAKIQARLVGQLGEGWSHLRFEAERGHVESRAQEGDLAEALTAAQGLLQLCLAAGETAYPEAAYDLALAYRNAGRYTREVGTAVQAVSLLQEASARFQKFGVEDRGARLMAAAVLSDLGDCWCDLGKLEEAARCYEQFADEYEREGSLRGVAVSKGKLGTVRMYQRRYPEALAAFQEARGMFTRLQEPVSLAATWQRIGMVYEEMQVWGEAEAAYRESLRIKITLNDTADMAATLGQLGTLLSAQGRWEDAVVHHRQVIDLCVRVQDQAGEGRARNNLADTLRQLGRLREARQEIERAITCGQPFGHAVELWKSYAILAAIETAAGQPDAAAQAHLQARKLYAQYRRDGGENYGTGAEWCQAVAAALAQGDGPQVQAQLEQVAKDPQLPAQAKTLSAVLLAILSGQRQPALADTPGLDYQNAVEVERLLETLNGGA
ncbi:MAG: tetratricopeptide repeat protein [Magnetococcales bacterium]|nr:tetratricopeptide repeat protein [Magnetococcales bacterium]